jgi:hypothetical protein
MRQAASKKMSGQPRERERERERERLLTTIKIVIVGLNV